MAMSGDRAASSTTQRLSVLRSKASGWVVVAAIVAAAPCLAQQPTGEVWRTFAQKLDTGSALVVRLQNGQRFHATLIDARADALVVQPRTRRPVPVQPIAYEAISTLERDERRGMGAAKALGIGIAAGAGTFFAILAILAASID
jgi:hypothetical protein